jgi:hypothetical protein
VRTTKYGATTVINAYSQYLLSTEDFEEQERLTWKA